MSTAALLLTPEEILALTGYRQPAAQLAELRRQGFHRARRNVLGAVVLEREHYVAVCRGEIQAERPRVKPPQLRPPTVRSKRGASA